MLPTVRRWKGSRTQCARRTSHCKRCVPTRPDTACLRSCVYKIAQLVMVDLLSIDCLRYTYVHTTTDVRDRTCPDRQLWPEKQEAAFLNHYTLGSSEPAKRLSRGPEGPPHCAATQLAHHAAPAALPRHCLAQAGGLGWRYARIEGDQAPVEQAGAASSDG
eukprot:350255-Chlamydomonas_euryale.AAC.36